MIKKIKYFTVLLLLSSSINAQDVIETLVSWPLDAPGTYTDFIYDTSKVDTVKYFKIDVNDGGLFNSTPIPASGGRWSRIPDGYIVDTKFFEVSFTPASAGTPQYLEITDIEFDAASNNVAFRPVGNLFLAYSYNSDFSDSTIIYNYPDGDISTASTGNPKQMDYTFESPLVLSAGDTIYFRVYPYNATNAGPFLAALVILDNTFFINGIARDVSDVSKVDNFTFTRTCISEGQLSWDLPAGFNAATDTIVVFAKKTSLIDQGTPNEDPNDYGTPITDLDSLDGTVPPDIQYQNDAAAMLVYRGTGTSVDLTNFEDGTTYSFLAFTVEGDGAGSIAYSNGALISGASPNELGDVSDFYGVSQSEKGVVFWNRYICSDSVLVVCNDTIITYDPNSQLIGSYTANNNYKATDNYFNGSDGSDGRVVFKGGNASAETVSIDSLTNETLYYVKIWNYVEGSWSAGVNVTIYPDTYKAIFTQTRSAGTDYVEFLTLTEIDFTALQYNISNYSACENGVLYSPGGNKVDVGILANLGTIPAGTFVRLFTSTTNELDSDDGLVKISSDNSFALKAVGGDQVMFYTGTGTDGETTDNLDCSSATTVYNFISAFNYGNDGWLPPGSGDVIDANNSYAPPSVSNLEMPSFFSTPNYSLKDQTIIAGDVETIHDDISNIGTNWATGLEGSPPIKLKNVQFSESEIQGSGFISLTLADEAIKVTLNNIVTVPNDSADIRYVVVARAGAAPDDPMDRYTCYEPNLDYTLADTVVTAAVGQFNNAGIPCGTSRTLGNGRVMYIGRDTTSFTLSDFPCGTRVYVSLYALTGNGITATFSEPITENTLVASSDIVYYSDGSGNFDDTDRWNLATDGGGSSFSGDFTDCINLVIQNGDTVTFDQDVLFGNLLIEAGGRAILNDMELTLTKDLEANDSLVTSDSRIIMAGLRGLNYIKGSGYIELYELEVDNSTTTGGQDKLRIQNDVAITEGVFISDGDLVINNGYTLTLKSAPTAAAALNQAAFLGQIPNGSSVSGDVSVERYLPTINTIAPGGSGQGVGWRYITSAVAGATYEQVMDDFTCTGFTGSQFPDYGIEFTGHYFPNLQKYDETVQGNQNMGFDGDFFTTVLNTPTTPPAIRNRRDKTEVIGVGHGIFAYIGPVEETFDFIGVPNQGDIDVTMTYTDNGLPNEDGWNLVANPYPCPVRMSGVPVSGGSVGGTIYIYNAETGIFSPFNRVLATTTLASGQAFWAKLTDSDATFEFEEEDKVENSNVRFYKSYEQYEKSLIVHMEMESNTLYADYTSIWFNNDATLGFDNEYDGYKLYSLLDNVSGISTTIEGFDADVSVNAIPELTEELSIPIKVNIRQAGNYTLSFEQFGDYILSSCLSLYDVELDSTISVDMMSTYTFYSELRAESEDARFILTMTPPLAVDAADATCFDVANGSATVNGIGSGPFTYTWYDANMEEIASETIDGASTLSEIGQGFYSVLVESSNSECASQEKGFYISQPAALENSFTTDDPSCNQNDGYINLSLDTATTWNISWLNLTNGQNGQIQNRFEYYTIGSLSYGEYEVTTTSECGAQSYMVNLVDLNPVVADFTIFSDTVYLVDNEVEVTFTNTSVNANEYSWFYAESQEELDNSLNGSYVYTEPGVYGVSLWSTNADGCYDRITHELVVMADPSSVDDLTGQIVRSYISYSGGNPQYVIELKDPKAVQIQMLNAMGQVINSQQVNVNGKTFVDLPTYDLSSGIYIIITLDDGTRIDTKKLFVR